MLKNRKGVTLIEVMIICVLVLILGLISNRIYEYQIEKAVATDAVNILRKIVDVEIAYRLENKQWCTSFDELPIKIEGEINGSSLITNTFVYTLESRASSSSSSSTLIVKANRDYGDDVVVTDSKRYAYGITFKIDSKDFNKEFAAELYIHPTVGYYSNMIYKSAVGYLNRKFAKK